MTDALKQAAQQVLEALGRIDTLRFADVEELKGLLRAALAQPAVPEQRIHAGGGAFPVDTQNVCQRCGKWAGAHATLPGQSRDHLCHCAPQPAAVAPAAPEPKLPEFFAQLDYDKNFNVLVSVYQRRPDATPVLVHQEPMKAQEAAPAPDNTACKSVQKRLAIQRGEAAAPERVPLTFTEQEIAEACIYAEVSDGQFQSVLIALHDNRRAHGIKQPGSDSGAS